MNSGNVLPKTWYNLIDGWKLPLRCRPNRVLYHILWTALPWSGTEWDIVDYRGIAWISTLYHRIRDCLEMLLNIIEYRGLSWISASYHRILGSQPRPKPAVTVPQAKWQSMPCLEVALNGISWIIMVIQINCHPGVWYFKFHLRLARARAGVARTRSF